MKDTPPHSLSLRYDQKARLALATSIVLVLLTALALVQVVANVVGRAQSDLNLARAAIAAAQADQRDPRTRTADGEQLLPGRSLADAQSAAQEHLKTLVERSGAGITSLQVTASSTREALTPVRLRAVLVVPEPSLAALLANVAASRPIFALEGLEAQIENSGRRDATAAPTLAVRLEAVAFARLPPGSRL